MKDWIEFILFKTFYYFFRMLPLRSAITIGSWIGSLNYCISGIRVKLVKQQLRDAFPEKSKKEINRIAHNVYRNLMKTAVEYYWLADKRKSIIEKIIKIQGLECFNQALSKGKGALLVTGHFDSWEITAILLDLLGYKLSIVLKPQRNKLFNDFTNRLRSSRKIDLIEMKYALRGIIKALRNNEIVAMLSDQDARENGIFVNFLNKPASTYPGIAKISLKTGSPIIFAISIRQRNNTHKIVIHPPIYPKKSGNMEQDISKYTQLHTSLLENYVRKYPEQWFWVHKRWKTLLHPDFIVTS